MLCGPAFDNQGLFIFYNQVLRVQSGPIYLEAIGAWSGSYWHLLRGQSGP